ncbi:hypothetical protein CDAR_468201 [Caerostris darwini]|uniref:Uncharacterized protein n=1 Tax=Caerostris darwini TaxID=1538125 RepID=A0AAV4WXJ8_9ARAC|nr:hypothetical protein CDAR_468201 [Caerostris darwini]
MPKPSQKSGSKNTKVNKTNNKTPVPPKPKVNNITRTQPPFTSRPVNDSRAYSARRTRCLMDFANANPSHSHIILRAFGSAKDKMRSSQNKFYMSFHLFEAYTHVISNSEFCTA